VAEEGFKAMEGIFDQDCKQFVTLFKESTFEGSKTTARKMKKIVVRETRYNLNLLLFHSTYLLIHTDSKMLTWPSSPLLVLLHDRP
jgi:hypothetical protein